jgi:hypothetical protein
MREWFLPRDLLGIDGERIVDKGRSLTETVELVAAELDGVPPRHASSAEVEPRSDERRVRRDEALRAVRIQVEPGSLAQHHRRTSSIMEP